MRDVALDPTLVDEVGEDAGSLLIVDALHLHEPQGCGVGLHRDLVALHQESHFLEEISVRDDFQFLQNEKNSPFNEYFLVGLQGLVEVAEVALPDSLHD